MAGPAASGVAAQGSIHRHGIRKRGDIDTAIGHGGRCEFREASQADPGFRSESLFHNSCARFGGIQGVKSAGHALDGVVAGGQPDDAVLSAIGRKREPGI